MIEEAYVSLEIARILKDKGFRAITNRYYNAQYEQIRTVSDTFMMDWNNEPYMRSITMPGSVAIPTLQMTMRWFREIHNININILYDLQRLAKTDGTTEDVDVYEVDIITKNGTIYIGNYNHYESACENAIIYCLTKLLKQ